MPWGQCEADSSRLLLLFPGGTQRCSGGVGLPRAYRGSQSRAGAERGVQAAQAVGGGPGKQALTPHHSDGTCLLRRKGICVKHQGSSIPLR